MTVNDKNIYNKTKPKANKHKKNLTEQPTTPPHKKKKTNQKKLVRDE